MMTSKIFAGMVLGALLWGGCVAAPGGTRLRVATATPNQLAAAAQEDNVWYEFQPGDEIPAHLGVLGAMQGGHGEAVALRAQQRFYLVKSKNGPLRVSFDGKTFAGQNATQMMVAVLPREEGPGGQIVWLVYVGESGDPEAELMKLVKRSQ